MPRRHPQETQFTLCKQENLNSITTASHRQIHCNYPDVTGVKLWTPERQTLIFSIYVPHTNYSQVLGEISIQLMLKEIEACIQQATESTDKPTTIIMAGDFNRHHPMWSKNRIYHVAIEHAEELVSFFHKHGLQPCLPRGTPTYWSMSYPGSNSTIDLTNSGRKPRRAYDRADWRRIGESVQAQMAQFSPIQTKAELDEVVAKLISCTASAINQYTPMSKPSPYSKRWFSPELKIQQGEVNRARRKWQESCAERGRQNPMSLILFEDMRKKRRAWTRAIEKAKATHWKEFLDRAGEGHLWRAASYMRPRESYGNIPPLKRETEEIVDNPGKAKLFMETFFPKMAAPENEADMEQREEIPWVPITEQEVHRALQAAKGMKAPGEDGMPMLPVDFHGGASAFIDDYFRWRVGKSAEENLKKLQEEDISRIEQWAKQSGSHFAAEKTELIHFTRKKSEQSKGRLLMQGAAIEPSATAKLLSVVFDHELREKEHVQQAVKRATRVDIALAGLRHLCPSQMRQVYQACVTLIMDYASTVWHNPLKDKRHLRVLNTVQRSALIQILSAFQTVATTTMEVETYMLPTHLRLKQRAQNVIVSLCTLPRDHPVREVLSRARRRRDNVGSQPRFPQKTYGSLLRT
ncbi:hypothetical protein GB937_010390 [Aspergillus fischeri]|nr:hypothetical protein GB937_010390 [Aspergillus fischeri]